jgi:hypothetical protein
MGKGRLILATGHESLRKLRAVARAVNRGLKADFPGLLSALAHWNAAAPIPIQAESLMILVRGAEAHLLHRDTSAALRQLRGAIDIVEAVVKRQTILNEPRPVPSD